MLNTINISEINDFKVGNATDEKNATGCTASYARRVPRQACA